LTAANRVTTSNRRWVLVGIGTCAGLLSGLLGVGGGIVMIPFLVMLGFSQHEAHATSLAAICPIALVGAAKFASAGEIEYGLAIALAAGSVVGAPLGARVMAGLPEGSLKVVFGVVMIVSGAVLLWP
jgi:uncharacterized membrane protein YfcA